MISTEQATELLSSHSISLKKKAKPLLEAMGMYIAEPVDMLSAGLILIPKSR
jgi:hypothetical protein